MRKYRKFAILVVVLNCLIIVGAILFYYKFAAFEAVDDSDLRFEYGHVPQHENAFPVLVEIGKAATSPKHLEKTLESMIGSYPENWNSELASSLITENDLLFQKLDRALTLPKAERFYPPQMSYESYYQSGWIQLARLLAIRSYVHYSDGNWDEAINDLSRIHDLSNRILTLKGSLIEVMIAEQMEKFMISALLDLMDEPGFPCQSRQRIDTLLQRPDGWIGHYRNGLRGEYMINVSSLDQCHFLAEETNSRIRIIWKIYYLSPFKNKMVREMATRFRNLIEAVDWEYEELDHLPFHDELTVQNLYWSTERDREFFVDVFKDYLWVRIRNNGLSEAALLKLALRCYAEDNHRLPDSLNDLVPNYFDELPLDPYTRQPFKYKPGEKLFYSVGKDLVDKGGIAKAKPTYWNEPTFLLNFKLASESEEKKSND